MAPIQKDDAEKKGEQHGIGNEGKVTLPPHGRTREASDKERTKGPFGPEVFADIFSRMIEGETLIKICRDPAMPSRKTVCARIAADSDLQGAYDRAMLLRADYYAESVLDLADNCQVGTKIINKNGKVEIVTADMVERTRLQIEARKWYAAKLAPRKYGDRLQTDLAVTVETHEERLQRLTGGKGG